MDSLIELEEPYRSKWRKGYLQTLPNGRKYVNLYNSRDDRSITSYGRYLMNVSAGKFLPRQIEADHVDEDRTNDSLSNIQPLSGEENRKKHVTLRTGFVQSDHAQICKECGKEIYDSHDRSFCSKSCASSSRIKEKRLEGNPLGGKPIDSKLVDEIRKLKSDGQSMRSIARELGVDRNTVHKYCKT